MATEIDELMDRAELAYTPEEIGKLIAYYRKAREAGPRPKKEKGPEAKIDLGQIGLVAKPAPGSQIKRRV